MAVEKMDIRIQPPGFWSVISTALGWAVACLLLLVVVGIGLMKLFEFLWPTLVWLVPVSILLGIQALALYRTIRLPDEEARKRHVFQATFLVVRTLVVIALFFATVQPIAQ